MKLFLDEYPALMSVLKARANRSPERIEVICQPKTPKATVRVKPRLERYRFLRSPEWKKVRDEVFDRDGRVCAECGSVHSLQIDHIIPRSKAPSLSLDVINLRVLCWDCNKAKAAKVTIDIVI